MNGHLQTTQFKDVMLLQWKPLSTDLNRGVKDEKVGDKNITREARSNLVGDMLEQLAGFMPEIAQLAIVPKATSLKWVSARTLRLRKDRPRHDAQVQNARTQTR